MMTIFDKIKNYFSNFGGSIKVEKGNLKVKIGKENNSAKDNSGNYSIFGGRDNTINITGLNEKQIEEMFEKYMAQFKSEKINEQSVIDNMITKFCAELISVKNETTQGFGDVKDCIEKSGEKVKKEFETFCETLTSEIKEIIGNHKKVTNAQTDKLKDIQQNIADEQTEAIKKYLYQKDCELHAEIHESIGLLYRVEEKVIETNEKIEGVYEKLKKSKEQIENIDKKIEELKSQGKSNSEEMDGLKKQLESLKNEEKKYNQQILILQNEMKGALDIIVKDFQEIKKLQVDTIQMNSEVYKEVMRFRGDAMSEIYKIINYFEDKKDDPALKGLLTEIEGLKSEIDKLESELEKARLKLLHMSSSGTSVDVVCKFCGHKTKRVLIDGKCICDFCGNHFNCTDIDPNINDKSNNKILEDLAKNDDNDDARVEKWQKKHTAVLEKVQYKNEDGLYRIKLNKDSVSRTGVLIIPPTYSFSQKANDLESKRKVTNISFCEPNTDDKDSLNLIKRVKILILPKDVKLSKFNGVFPFRQMESLEKVFQYVSQTETEPKDKICRMIKEANKGA